MNINLTPKLEKLIQDKVKSGHYDSVSDVIAEGLRLLYERDKIQEVRLAELKEKIREGIESADRGELMDGDEFFAQTFNDDDFEMVSDQLATELADYVGSNPPILTDYAVSREGSKLN